MRVPLCKDLLTQKCAKLRQVSAAPSLQKAALAAAAVLELACVRLAILEIVAMERLKYKHIISYIWSKNKDMNRKILKYLERWRSRPGRRPLLLRGARQVGKTWAVRQHGKGYQHFIECDLDERPEYARLVRDLYGTPDKLILALQNLTGVPAIPGKTLLFLMRFKKRQRR